MAEVGEALRPLRPTSELQTLLRTTLTDSADVFGLVLCDSLLTDNRGEAKRGELCCCETTDAGAATDSLVAAVDSVAE